MKILMLYVGYHNQSLPDRLSCCLFLLFGHIDDASASYITIVVPEFGYHSQRLSARYSWCSVASGDIDVA